MFKIFLVFLLLTASICSVLLSQKADDDGGGVVHAAAGLPEKWFQQLRQISHGFIEGLQGGDESLSRQKIIETVAA